MRQQFSMVKRLLLAGVALFVLVAASARGEDIQLAPGAPNQYVVKSGDTLWSISARFLKDPWRWPEIWRTNREQIKNPHWIYPGDVVVLDMSDGKPRLTLERGGKLVAPQVPREAARDGSRDVTVRLSPRVREAPIDVTAIPSIPVGDLQPWLSRPLVTGSAGLVNGAEVVAGRDARVVRGENDVIYVAGIDRAAGDSWYLYRPGRVFSSYDNPADVLGYEQRFLGTAKVERYGDIATVRIVNAREEIVLGDKLVPQPRGQLINYAPHAPDQPVFGHVIALDNEASEAGVGSILTIDRGMEDGIDIGTVLAVYKTFEPVPDPRPSTDPDILKRFIDQTKGDPPDHMLDLPEERNALVFIFRVFDRVSYGLLVRTYDPVEVGNAVRKP